MQGAAAGERIFEILDAPSAVPDDGTRAARAVPRRDPLRAGRASPTASGRCCTSSTLEIRKGEVVALVGASGGGKTTIANLLPRFWDPTGGRITIDGQDIREVDAREPARAARARDAGDGALQRHHPGEHRLRPPGGPARRRWSGGAARPGARLHPRAAAGLRHARRRAGRRSSPAASGSGSPSPAPSSRTRPSWSSTRRRARSTPRASARSSGRSTRSWRLDGGAPPHHARHRPPALDHPERRPHRGPLGGARGRGGAPRRARRARAASTRGSTASTRGGRRGARRRRVSAALA